LIFEVIHICQKHRLEDTSATKLIPLEEVVQLLIHMLELFII